MQSKILLAALAAVILASCGFAEDMQDAMENVNAIERELADRYGFDAQVGFNIHNGVLATVQVSVPGDEVTGMQVDDLIDQVSASVAKQFDEAPQALLVTVVIRP